MATTASALYRPAEDVPPIDVDERVPLLFDYTEMFAGDPISGTPVITCEVTAGTDANPASRMDGSPVVSDPNVVQWMTGCLVGATYLVRCKAASAGGKIEVQAISLRCVRVGAADV